MMDQKYYEDENSILRQIIKHKDIEIEGYKNNLKRATEMYDNLLVDYTDLVQKYDSLAMKTMKRDLEV